MARPKIEIDGDFVFKLASLGCTTEEIADYFECSRDTIERRFMSDLVQGRSEMKMTLRQCQLDAAKKGNAALLIWLGKQMLGQVERTQIDISKIDDETFIAEAQRRLKQDSNSDDQK